MPTRNPSTRALADARTAGTVTASHGGREARLQGLRNIHPDCDHALLVDSFEAAERRVVFTSLALGGQFSASS